MKASKCFHCGEAASAQVWRTQPPQRRKWICKEIACWKAWWKLTDKEQA